MTQSIAPVRHHLQGGAVEEQGLGKHKDAEEDTDHPVDVKHDVVLVPGDHHDGGL